MVVADLHVHTTNSDGRLTLADVPAAAARADLTAVAITDHDRLHPALDEAVVDRDGLTVIHGIELRVETATERVDLLGYGARPTAELTAAIDRLQQNRMDRGRAIVAAVEDRLGVTLEVAIEPGLGRPDIARAVAAHPETALDYQATFDELIGNDGPCYVAREVPDFERGRRLLTDACDLVALAHPLRYDDPEAALSVTDRLDGVERWYPYGGLVDSEPVDHAIVDNDLVPTGGSDAHEEELGVTGLRETDYRRVSAHLST